MKPSKEWNHNNNKKKKNRFQWNIFKLRKRNKLEKYSHPNLYRDPQQIQLPLPLAQDSDRTMGDVVRPSQTTYEYYDNPSRTPTTRITANHRKNVMPQEIRFRKSTDPDAPDSPLSLISHLTGDDLALKDLPFKTSKTNSFAIFSGGLVSLASETREEKDDASEDLNLDWNVSKPLFRTNPYPKTTSDSSSVGNRFLSVHEMERIQTKKPSLLSSSTYIQRLIHETFFDVDVLRSGYVDRKELYTGVILLQLKFTSSFRILSAFTCIRPASRAQVYEIFDVIDCDKSGRLNQLEFTTAMLFFISQIQSQIIVTWAILLTMLSLSTFLSSKVYGILAEVQGVQFMKGHILSWMSLSTDFITPYIGKSLTSVLYRIYEYFICGEDHCSKSPWLWVFVGFWWLPWIVSLCEALSHRRTQGKQDKRKRIT